VAAECPSDHALSEFVTGVLPPPESTAVSEHLRECGRCAARVRGLEQSAALTDSLLGDLRRPPPAPPPDPEFRAAVDRLLSSPPAGPALPVVGDIIGNYKLVEVLGEGGMGVVYRAVHTRLDKEVAVKVIRRSRAIDSHAVERFGREMKAAGKFRHPNLVQATDAGVAGDVPYLVMEYVHGTDLARLVVRDGPLSPESACDLIRQAAVGLHHAHEHGLVHRDVKPSNLILGSDGVVRVLDLGLALLPGDAPATELVAATDTTADPDDTLTSPGQLLGTRHYIAPEQQVDSHRVDPRADVYGLGCTLVFLLTGQPYTLGGPFPPQLPTELWKKLLASFPDDRFASASAVVEALAPHCGRGKPAPRSHRARWLAPAVAITTLLAAGVGIALLANKKAPIQTAGDPTPVEVAPPPRVSLPRGALPMTAEEARRLQNDTADCLEQPVAVKNSLGMEMVLIPRGEFAMSDHYSVTLTRPFRIATTEVTFAQFAKFCDETGHKTPAEQVKIASAFRTWKPLNQFPHPVGKPVHRLAPGWGKYDDDGPIGYVSWDDIDAFLKWLSEREGRKYRLPTHAEWVWACRAGSATHFYWDVAAENANDYAWTRQSGADRPQPVGKLRPNAWGLFDMLGNVEELVQDYHAFGYVPTGRMVDPVGPPAPVRPSSITNRLTCGGSYMTHLQLPVQTGTSGYSVVYSNQGFRVVME
jgi:serine/threonine protein kinase